MRIVLIDDHQIFREGLQSLLSVHEDISVIGQASDGREGLTLIQDTQPDLAVVDIHLPESSGLEILKAVRHQKLATKIILLTSDRKAADAATAIELGVDGYVLKDDAFEDLEMSIRSAIQGKPYISPTIASLIITQQRTTIHDLKQLSQREREVLTFIADGMTNKEIASQMSISVNTVRTHRARLMDKLDLHTTGELVRYALDRGLVD